MCVIFLAFLSFLCYNIIIKLTNRIMSSDLPVAAEAEKPLNISKENAVKVIKDLLGEGANLLHIQINGVSHNQATGVVAVSFIKLRPTGVPAPTPAYDVIDKLKKEKGYYVHLQDVGPGHWDEVVLLPEELFQEAPAQKKEGPARDKVRKVVE